MKIRPTLAAALAVLSIALVTGCNNAKIPDEGKVMRDTAGNAYLVKFHLGDVYTVDPLPGERK